MKRWMLFLLIAVLTASSACAEEVGTNWLVVFEEGVHLLDAPEGTLIAELGYQVLPWQGEVRVNDVLWYRVGHPRHGSGVVLASEVRPIVGLDEPARADMRQGPLSDNLLAYCKALHLYQLEQGFRVKDGTGYALSLDVSCAYTRTDVVRMMYEHGLIAMDERYESLDDSHAAEILRVHYGTDSLWEIFTADGIRGTVIHPADWHGTEPPTCEEREALAQGLQAVERAFEQEAAQKIQYFKRNQP